jgi:ankyrin repeat protein
VLHFAAVNGANTALRFIAEGCYIPDINCRNANGASPLHLAAAFEGDGETVEILISHGANIDAESKAGERAVHSAARSGNESVISALLQNDSRAGCQGMDPRTRCIGLWASRDRPLVHGAWSARR